MRIFNETKTQEIDKENVDYSKYKLERTKLLIAHHEAISEIQEKSHYEIIKEYENGGRDVRKVVDVEYVAPKEAYDEYEDILYLVPLTKVELARKQISEKKLLLEKYKEDVEQVDLFGMERSDYAEKRKICANIIIELRELEKIVKGE